MLACSWSGLHQHKWVDLHSSIPIPKACDETKRIICAVYTGISVSRRNEHAAIDNFNARRSVSQDRHYQEKREAYLGLLGALHKAAVKHSDENSKEFALWQTRCRLFGSPDVSRFVQAMIDTNDRPRAERDAAFNGLVESMRKDLH